MSYVPEKLPCGKKVNEDYQKGKKVECCQTVCKDKTKKEIDDCHKSLKKPTVSGRYGQDWVNPNSKDRLFSH